MKKTLLAFLTAFIFINISIAQDVDYRYSIDVDGFYQQYTYSLESCNCDEKTERGSQMSKRMLPADFRTNSLLAYRIKIDVPIKVAALAKVMEDDYGVVKATILDEDSDGFHDHLLILVSDRFDRSSFELAATGVFEEFGSDDAAATLKQMDNKLYDIYITK